jgi:cytochrome c-type biogenesis protein CcmE
MLRLKFILGGAVILAALAYLGFVGFEESKAYYITVDEYFSMKDSLHGKTIKLAGEVMAGSIDRSRSQMEFAISNGGQSIKVRYVGKEIVPDTFKDGTKTLVEGQVARDGTFQAKHIEAKCVSKYEAEYGTRTVNGQSR